MSDHASPSTIPDGLGDAGRELWSSVADDYELEVHEARLLLEACRSADLLDDLAVILARDGVMIESNDGPRTHPASVEARQQRLVLGRLISALRLPAGDEEDTQAGARRPQRRSGFRGIYGVRGAVS